MSDYEKWKQWFDAWNVEYKETNYVDGTSCLIIDGDLAATMIEFDTQKKFVRVNASE